MIVYLFCGPAGFLWARKSGAMTESGNSTCVSSNPWVVDGTGGGLIIKRSRFHAKSILPRFNACSSSSAGKEIVALAGSASICLMASGHPPEICANGTTSGEVGTAGA